MIINDDGNSQSSFEDDDLDDVNGVDHFSIQSEVDNLVEDDFEDESVEEENFNFNEEPNGHVFSDYIFQTINSPNVSLKNKIFCIATFFPTIPNTVLNAFLALLFFWGFDVPKEARTIKGTPRSGPSSESFVHFGH